MSILTSKEMFINIKNPPVYNSRKSYFEQSSEVLNFYTEERRKITEGVYIGGYFIHPWLYFHLNFFKTPVPIPDKNGRMFERVVNPPLDDLIMYIIDSYKEAEETNKGLLLFGSRGSTKSTTLTSLVSWLNIIKENGTTSIIGGSEPDLKAISSLMEIGFTKIHPAFFLPRLNSDWDSEVIFGVKEKNNQKLIHSRISITNANKGSSKESEKGAGLSPVGFILDEALHEDSIVYLEKEEKSIKDVQVGEKIFGADGKLTEVLRKIDPGVVDTYKFILSDGREITSSDNHLWKVYDTRLSRYREFTTEQIRKKYYYTKYDKRYDKTYKSLIFSIPMCEPIKYKKRDLLIDPYWLGLYLGDGKRGTGTVYSIDKEILDHCEKYSRELGLNFNLKKPCEDRCPDYKSANIIKNKGEKNNKILDYLRIYGVAEEKKVPEDYLKGSVEQRLELLRGLMDTDGGCDIAGSIEFSSSCKGITDGFKRLCEGLGIKYKIYRGVGEYKDADGNRVICRDKIRFTLYTDLRVFNLERKLDRVKNTRIKKESKGYKKAKAYKERVAIKDIIYQGKSQVYCIKVDNKDKLFLTDNQIVTHNCGKFASKGILESALPSFMTQHGAKLVPVLAGTSGNEELSRDAKDILSDPEAFKLISMNWDRLERGVPEEAITWERSKKEKFSIFVPGQMSYRLEVPKVKKKFSEYLGIDNKNLAKIDINVTDWVPASETIKNRNKSLKKEKDRQKNQMYYPLEIADIFLTSSSNPFPVPLIEKRIRELEDKGIIGKDIGIYREGSKFKHEFVKKKRAAVSHGGGLADAPIILFGEFPEEIPPKGLYVSGLDAYKLDQSETDSLGAFYVLKRRGQAPNEPCETIASSYVARPERMREFNDTCETISDTWNAECLMESIDISFQQHLQAKGREGEILAENVNFASLLSKKRHKARSKFGLFPHTANNDYRFNLLVGFCKDEHVVDIDDDGNQVYKLGVEFIDDIDLLKEMRDWFKGGNFDRIVAFSHALVLARELDKNHIQPERKDKRDVYSKSEQEKRQRLLSTNRYGMTRGRRY